MLNEQGFDLWADGYDQSVGLSDEDGSYPFAGYRALLNAIYDKVLRNGGGKVLDIGFGTGTLTAKLYAQGCQIYGQDFSGNMLAIAKFKMPDATLYQGDFSLGLAQPLIEQTYDAIVATYSLHHLTNEQKKRFLRTLVPLLTEHGRIYVGDVAFQTRDQLNRCRAETGEEWDGDEVYWVYDELKTAFPHSRFTPYSHCAGLLEIWP